VFALSGLGGTYEVSQYEGLYVSVALSIGATSAMAAECITTANPGGGLVFICRQIGKILSDIGQVACPVQVMNMAGGGATADQVRFVGAIGADPGVIVVTADSPFMTLNNLVDAIICCLCSWIVFGWFRPPQGFDGHVRSQFHRHYGHQIHRY
jgi:hypothetical protein